MPVTFIQIFKGTLAIKINISRYYSARFLIIFTICSISTLTGYANPASDSATSTSFGDVNDPYMSKEFEISKPGLLKVFTVGGNIDIVRSPTAQKVKVELFVDRGFTFWSNASNLDNFRITILQRENEIVASVEQKKRDTGFFSNRMSFSFRVHVPESMSTELKTLGGNIAMERIHGTQSIKTGGGNISLSDISGKLQAYTSGGNIDINDSQGTIYAQTEGGNISVDRSSGEIRLKTKGGRIISKRISGTMLAQVGGGDIEADFMRVAEGIDLETSAGNIYLEVPDQIGYELLLQGTEVDFSNTQKLSGKIQSNLISATYKDSGPPINLSTNAGTVTLKIK